MLNKSAKLIEELRKELGSITLEEIKALEEPALTDADLMARANDSEIFYKNHFEKVLRAIDYKQLQDIGEKAVSDELLQFGRGTLNGIYIVMQWFKNQISISRSRFEEKEKPEPGETP